MTSSSLDSVLILADSELNFLALDDNSAGGCDAQITVTLPAGRYYLMANTYSGSSSCGDITGPYELTIGYVQTKLLTLKVEEDDNSNIRFTGGITADNGLTFGNRFLPTDSLDISVNIDVNPDHVGQPGFILVFAELQGGQMLFKNEQGDFVVLDPLQPQLPIATRKTLERIEKVNIIENLVAADLDIDNIEVDFFVGYSLQSNFLELFSHTEPINLIIEP